MPPTDELRIASVFPLFSDNSEDLETVHCAFGKLQRIAKFDMILCWYK